MVALSGQREWHSTLCLVMSCSDRRGEAGRGTVTEGVLGCWGCDVLLCCSGGNKPDPPQVGSPWLLCCPPPWMGPIPRLCPGCLEEQPLLWVGLGLLSPSCQWTTWEFFCLINSIYFFPTQMSFPPCQGSI